MIKVEGALSNAGDHEVLMSWEYKKISIFCMEAVNDELIMIFLTHSVAVFKKDLLT